MTAPDWAELDQAEASVRTIRADYDHALLKRRACVRRLREGDATIYAIAKRIGVTQSAVRKMLDL
jgi:transposase-like protein